MTSSPTIWRVLRGWMQCSSGYPWDRVDRALLSCASPRVVCRLGSVVSIAADSAHCAAPSWLGLGEGGGWILRWPLVVTSPSSLFRLCAMCDLGACPPPPPGAAAGHPATRNIPTTPAAAGTSHRGFGGFHLASQSLSPRNPLHIPPPASAAPPPPLRSPTCMCSLMHPSLQPWVGDLGPCVCLSMRVFASFGSLLPSFLTPLVPRIPNSLVIRLADTPCPPLCPLVVCVVCRCPSPSSWTT